MSTAFSTVRIDKWLWAARFYKTRALAVKAIKNSKISLNKNTVKPSTNLTPGDQLTIKNGLFQTVIMVEKLSDKRGSATIAKTLYTETIDSITQREELKQNLAAQPKVIMDKRKPNKYSVRTNRALKRGE